MLVHLLPKQICSHLLKLQRLEDSGFMPGKPIIDLIIAPRVLVERRHEFRQGIFAFYNDIKKAFDSLHLETLWELLRQRWVYAWITEQISGFYSWTESAVKCDGSVSSFFLGNTRARQRCIISPSLFNTCMELVVG